MAQNSLKIAKWGNGQGIRLPMAVMKLLSLKVGDELQMNGTTSRKRTHKIDKF